ASIGDADAVRLEKIARRLSRNGPPEWEDLVQMALTRALDGTRRCPREVDLVRFLAEAMRSIASDSAKARKRKPELRLVPKTGGGDNDDGFTEFDFADPSPNAEETLAEEQELDLIRGHVIALFGEDLIAQTIIEGEMDGMEAHELQELTNLDPTAYASKRRFI